MFNFKKNLYIAGAFALCALAGCSSDNSSSAGSTTIPNATAEKIEFTTAATSTITVDGGELKSFEAENGVSVFCYANGIGYSSEIQIDANKMIVTHMKLENAGELCSEIFEQFSASCNSIPSWWKGCDENGTVDVFCGDSRMTSFTKCTANNPPSCSTHEADTTVTFKTVESKFQATFSNICYTISKNASSSFGGGTTLSSSSVSGESSSSVEPQDTISIIEVPRDTTPIDTAKYTLSNYTAQFTDVPSELSFDSHVLAYSGNWQDLSGLKIKEISLDEVAQKFPLTTAVARGKPLPENCKLFVIGTDDGAQPTGHVLSKISKGSIEITAVYPGGTCMQTAMFFTVAFLVEDCDGLLDENAEISYKRFTSETWACETLGSPTKEASAYGEWYRADLRE
ncbi:MAG: hypothetical protein IKT05_06935 [Fibrobacter sp.]|nr:hypothetical protein [Fibrobacter sp.]